MRLLRHWKMILGLMAIFATGVGTGGVAVIVLLHRVITTPVTTQRLVDSRMSDLDRKLKLTPQQKVKIRPILEAAVERLRGIGGEAFEKMIATAEQTHADVSSELTPEQQVEFNKVRAQIINNLRELSQREISIKGAGRRRAAPKRPAMEVPDEAPK